MSVAVALEALREQLDKFGRFSFLTTVGDGAAHVVSVGVDFDGTRFTIGAGKTSVRNIVQSGRATLLWPGNPYSLIVDGHATVDAAVAVVTPTRAVLHRVADAPTDLPSCVTLESPTS